MNKIFICCNTCLLLGLLISPTGLTGPIPLASPSPGPPPVSATLRIKVLSTLDQPVPGVNVSLFALKGPEREKIISYRVSGVSGEIKPEALSATLFEKELAPGPYRVEVTAEGWVGEVVKETVLSDGEMKELEIKLNPGRVISGQVVDEKGQPLAGVKINYWAVGEDSIPFFRSTDRKIVSDGGGRFDIKSLKEGIYSLSASLPGYIKCTERDVGTGTEDTRLALREGFVIKGSLRGDLDGLESPVRLEFRKGKWESSSRKVPIDPEKNYCVSDLKKGGYDLRLKDRDYTSDWVRNIEAVSLEEAVPVILTVYRGASISGRVTGAETELPLNNVRVVLSPVDSTKKESDTTDEEGEFQFRAMPGGEYELKARWWSDPYSKYRVEKKIRLTAGENLTGVRLEFDPGRKITFNGMVVDEEGEAVSGSEIMVFFRRPGKKRFQRNYRQKTQSDDAGCFTLPFFSEGEGEIKLAARKKGFAQTRGELISISPERDSVEGIVLILSSGRSLQVEVENEEGESVVGAMVSLDDDWSSRRESVISISARKKLTDVKGSCRFDHLPPADYKIEVSKDGYGMESRRKVKLEEGESKGTVRIVLKEGRDLRVLVKNVRGEAVEGARVSVQEEGHGFTVIMSSMERDNSTDSQGSFILRDEPAGPLYISVQAEEYVTARRQRVDVDQDEVIVILKDAGSIRGRFLRAGKKPVSEVTLIPRKQKAGPFDFDFIFFSSRQTIELGDGIFKITNLGPGVYDLTVRSPGLATQKIEGIEIEPGQETDLGEITLEPESMITGRVFGILNGTPLEEARVWIKGMGLGDFSSGSMDMTDAEGSFSLEGLSPGDYTLTVSAKDYKAEEVPGILLSAGEEKEIPVITLERLTPEEKEERERRQNIVPSLGIRIGEMEGEQFFKSLPIAEVMPGSAAERGGLTAGDAILKINGKTFSEDPGGFLKGLMSKPGTSIKITVERGGSGKEEEVEVTIGDWDFEELMKQMIGE
ncbi:MAG: carboxypeptidase regulatory-like domain-containing protein [Candidatus Euphemobacter frigidus]|nr:carboxypeptidase regulatory-like domain-containing protein [Candidatus Euphemobacter frigidus]MDP8276688.1 carboxypeptidase regulatory-like domain-containing protein [Candidatus Euphemobacter frigidus]